MLYELKLTEGAGGTLSPVQFSGLEGHGRLEKDLETLLDKHLLDVLFEEAPLLPIFRERQRQPEADLYALNEEGDLVVFELKRGGVGADAVQQLLRYAQDAGRWTLDDLASKFAQYAAGSRNGVPDLREAHQEAFHLGQALPAHQFNRRQHLWLVGNASDNQLVSAVEYWQRQGLSIQFAPYRVYSIAGSLYFEFFSPPHDRHTNPADIKGVLFDTNRSYDEDAIWHMIDKRRVAAFGDAKVCADYLNPRDLVFFCHRGYGVVAAGEVVGPTKASGPDERYHDVRFLTRVPVKTEGIDRLMPFADVSAAIGKSFFWARTAKVPYLSHDEARTLLRKLLDVLGESGSGV